MRSRASLLLAAFLFPVLHPLLLIGQNQSPPMSPQLGSAEYPLCLFPATKAEHDPAAMTLLNRVVAQGIVLLPTSPRVMLKGEANKIHGDITAPSFLFGTVQGRGMSRHFRPDRQRSNHSSRTNSSTNNAAFSPSMAKVHSVHFGRPLLEIIPMLSVDPASAELSSVTMVASGGGFTTIRIAPVNRSFSLMQQKQAGAIVDLTFESEHAQLVRAMIRLAGCEQTDGFTRKLEFADYKEINGRIIPSVITSTYGKSKYIYHVQSVRVGK